MDLFLLVVLLAPDDRLVLDEDAAFDDVTEEI